MGDSKWREPRGGAAPAAPTVNVTVDIGGAIASGPDPMDFEELGYYARRIWHGPNCTCWHVWAQATERIHCPMD